MIQPTQTGNTENINIARGLVTIVVNTRFNIPSNIGLPDEHWGLLSIVGPENVCQNRNHFSNGKFRGAVSITISTAL